MPTLTIDIDQETLDLLARTGGTPEETLRRLVESWRLGRARWDELQASMRVSELAAGLGEPVAQADAKAAAHDLERPAASAVGGLILRGVGQHCHGATDEAVETLRRAVELAPENPGAHLTLATILRAQGDHPGTVEACRAALVLDPDLPMARTILALALKEMGNVEEAIAALREAVERDPMEGEAVGALARLLAERGDAEGAHRALRQFLWFAEGERERIDDSTRMVMEELEALGGDAQSDA